MIDSTVLQGAAHVIEVANGLHVFEGATYLTLLSTAGYLVRRFHKGELSMTGQFGAVCGDIQTLTKTLDDHITNSPTINSCTVHTQSLERLVRREHRRVVDQVQAIVTDQDRKLETLDKELDELKERENIRRGRNGVT